MTQDNTSQLNTNVAPPTEANYLAATPQKESINSSSNPVELAYNPKDYETKVETPATEVVETQETKTEPVDTHKLANLAKTERRLAQKAKEAEEVIKRAESIKAAFQEPDLVQALQKVGVNPKEAFNKLMEYSLKETQPPKTPEQIAKDDMESRLKSYEEKLNNVTSTLEEERTMAAHQSAMTNYVAPVINANPEKYETLISIYGNSENVIKEVYSQMYNEFINSNGKNKYTAEETADALEAHWSEQFKTSLSAAQKLKKYSHYFKDEAEEKAKAEKKLLEEAINKTPLTRAERYESVLADYAKENPPVTKEIKESPKTLTNNMNLTPGALHEGINKTSRKEQIAKFMKNYKE